MACHFGFEHHEPKSSKGDTFRDKGDIVGYDVDLAALMCASLGVEPEFIDTQWSGVIPALYAGRFDVIMSSMSYRKERLEKVAFSIPYAEAAQALLIRAEDAETITSINGLSGKVLGVKLGSPGEMMKPGLDEEIAAAAGAGFSSRRLCDCAPDWQAQLGRHRRAKGRSRDCRVDGRRTDPPQRQRRNLRTSGKVVWLQNGVGGHDPDILLKSHI